MACSVTPPPQGFAYLTLESLNNLPNSAVVMVPLPSFFESKANAYDIITSLECWNSNRMDHQLVFLCVPALQEST